MTVLGTGIMGAGMARNLVRAGHAVTVWNRTAQKARPLADDGADVADDPAAAVAGAQVVVTMLFDADSVAEVMDRALPALPAGAVWVQAATVGLDGTARLVALAGRHGVAFVDAPVLGTRKPAEDGMLTVLASGPPHLRAAVEPVFEAIGARTVWVGDVAGAAHRLKLVANSWVLALTAATAQAVALAEGLGVPPRAFLDTIAGGPLDSGYAQVKGAAMIAGDFAPSFGVDGAAKDARLIAEAAEGAGVDSGLARALAQSYRSAADGRDGQVDMAAVVQAFRPARPPR